MRKDKKNGKGEEGGCPGEEEHPEREGEGAQVVAELFGEEEVGGVKNVHSDNEEVANDGFVGNGEFVDA